jgi:hypothetical protein
VQSQSPRPRSARVPAMFARFAVRSANPASMRMMTFTARAE